MVAAQYFPNLSQPVELGRQVRKGRVIVAANPGREAQVVTRAQGKGRQANHHYHNEP
jgi:hypothetical protein